jgi:hypothetical protein
LVSPQKFFGRNTGRNDEMQLTSTSTLTSSNGCLQRPPAASVRTWGAVVATQPEFLRRLLEAPVLASKC